MVAAAVLEDGRQHGLAVATVVQPGELVGERLGAQLLALGGVRVGDRCQRGEAFNQHYLGGREQHILGELCI